MTHDEQARALERAARSALAAIEEDSERAPKWLLPLYQAIPELLFDPDLDLDRIQQAAGLDHPDPWTAMGHEVGQSPWSYLRDARLGTAALLLLETEMSIADAGYLVGYGSAPSFRRLLRSFLGMPPSRYRRRARRRLDRAGTLPEGADTSEFWRRMHAGELSEEEARRLDDYLGRLAGESAPPPAAGAGAERWARLRLTLAEGLADTLEILPFAEQRRLVRDAVVFPGGSFFEFLSQRSAEACGRGAGDPEGRGEGGHPRERRHPRERGDQPPAVARDRPAGCQRGVELALLAIDSLAANRMLETAPDVGFQLELMKRGVARSRERLQSFESPVLEQSHEEARVRAELYRRQDAVAGKMRQVRHICRGLYGPEGVERVGLQEEPERGAWMLYQQGKMVKESLGNPDLGLEPLIEIATGDDVATPEEQMAAKLEPELSELGELVGDRHLENRKRADVRSRRRRAFEEFDRDVRAIVRTAQGMFRLAGRDDLAERFRPILQRVTRKTRKASSEDAPAATTGESEPETPETAETPETETPAETSA